MVPTIRHFNRFYTSRLGLLNQGYLNSPFSLTEVRILYELNYQPHATATLIAAALDLDHGYLSRILLSFEKRRLIRRDPSKTDGRQTHISLTQSGRRLFSILEKTSNQTIAAMLRKLNGTQQTQLVQSMQTIQTILGGAETESKTPYLLRMHRPGDMGWVIHRHGAVYAEEYGWDERFEALVAEIAAKFIQNLDPKRERCWIAEKDGQIVGSVFLVRKSAKVAKLRLLLVEPSARGLGIGNRLVEECIRFAKQAAYKKITLWTQSNLKAARAIYKKHGFKLTTQESRNDFGANLISETWTLTLN